MRTIGLKPEDRVLLLERRSGLEVVHNALVTHVSMQERLAGAQGEMAIGAVIVVPLNEARRTEEIDPVIRFDNVVHFSHRDWLEGRSAVAYVELPPQTGVCRFCGCTEARACEPPCRWVDPSRTVCSSWECVDKLRMELLDQIIARSA